MYRFYFYDEARKQLRNISEEMVKNMMQALPDGIAIYGVSQKDFLELYTTDCSDFIKALDEERPVVILNLGESINDNEFEAADETFLDISIQEYPRKFVDLRRIKGGGYNK